MLLTTSQASDALRRASARRLLPSALGSGEQRDAFSAAVRRGSVFSARVANTRALQAIKRMIERRLQGGRDYSPNATATSGRDGNDRAQLMYELRQVMLSLGYKPATGFPGDDVPPAEPGSLQDLTSDMRLGLIIDTQDGLMRGAANKAKGLSGTRVWQFPYWELKRLFEREQPRGLMPGTKGWAERWSIAGGPKPVFAGGNDARLIALKTDPVWSNLGDSALFNDALDVDYPPFAFRSGFDRIEIHRSEAQALGLDLPSITEAQASTATSDSNTEQSAKLAPVPKLSPRGLDDASLSALQAKLAALRKSNPGTYGRLAA